MINTERTTSVVTKAQVVRAQKIIADARDKREDQQKTVAIFPILLLYVRVDA